MTLHDEYKIGLSKINKLLQEKYAIARSLSEKDFDLTKEISDLNYFKSNLEFGMKWQERCHAPGVYNGIENINANKVYE